MIESFRSSDLIVSEAVIPPATVQSGLSKGSHQISCESYQTTSNVNFLDVRRITENLICEISADHDRNRDAGVVNVHVASDPRCVPSHANVTGDFKPMCSGQTGHSRLLESHAETRFAPPVRAFGRSKPRPLKLTFPLAKRLVWTHGIYSANDLSNLSSRPPSPLNAHLSRPPPFIVRPDCTRTPTRQGCIQRSDLHKDTKTRWCSSTWFRTILVSHGDQCIPRTCWWCVFRVSPLPWIAVPTQSHRDVTKSDTGADGSG